MESLLVRRAVVLVPSMFVVAIMLIVPVASAGVFDVGYWWAHENKLPPTYKQGVQANLNVVSAIYTTDRDVDYPSYSSVTYSVTVILPDGYWVQVGYVRGWIALGAHGGLAEMTVPTVYVESGGPSWSIRSVYNSLTVGTTHNFMIKRTGVDAFGFWLWTAYVDGVAKQSVQEYADYATEYIAQGECHDRRDSSTSHVTFSSLQQYQITWNRFGYPIYKWYAWDGYTTSASGVTGDWRANFYSNSLECWLL